MWIYGYPGDILSYVYGIWALNNGIITNVFPNQVVLIGLLRFLSSLSSEITAINLLILIAFVLSFAFTWVLVASFGNRMVAFFPAAAYASSQFIWWHAMQNPELVLAASLLPLYFWSLMKLSVIISKSGKTETLSGAGFGDGGRRVWYRLPGNVVYPVLCGLVLALVFLSSFYIGYFSIVFSVVYIIFTVFWDLLVIQIFAGWGKTLMGLIIFALSFSLLALPGIYPVIEYGLGKADATTTLGINDSLERNSLLDIIAFGARPWDYLLPSMDHPIVGQLSRGFYEKIRRDFSYQFWSTFLPERSNFIAYTVIFLSLFGLAKSFGEVDVKMRRMIQVTALSGFFMFLVSLPPVVSFRGFHFFLPSYPLFIILPMFRVYARAGVFVLLSCVILSGYGLKKLVMQIKSKDDRFIVSGVNLKARKSVVLLAVITGIAILENFSFPPFPVMDVSNVPDVYRWIRERPGEVLIAEYPRDNSVNDLGGGCPGWLDSDVIRDWNRSYENFYKIFHGKRVFDFWRFKSSDRVVVADLGRPESYNLLKKEMVDFVIVHTKEPIIGVRPWPYPQKNPLDECWSRRLATSERQVYKGYQLVAEFDDGKVYRVQ